MRLSTIRFLLLMLATPLALCARPAQAVCIQPPVHLLVGDTASDSMCQYNDIQSAIDAASTNPQCSTVIHVTREHLYTQQHLTISNRNITLAGWNDGVTCADIRSTCDFLNCPLPANAPNPYVTISGHNGDSVLHIDGASNVSLLNVEISGGTVGSDQSGGGIYYGGTGNLVLTSTVVNLNHAGYGAGIDMNPSGGPATLTLNEYSQVIVNTADVSGGGIRLQGNTRMYALKAHTLIGYNHAPNGYGGGMEVLGPARADIGSPGFNGLGVISNNDAQYGGGMDILTFDDGADALVRLFSTDANNPVTISDNFASNAGGAVYLKPFLSLFGVARSALCAYDFHIDRNDAPEGAAIYADSAYASLGDPLGSGVALNTNPDATPFGTKICVKTEPPTALGAVACAPGVQCSRLLGNKTEDAGGQAIAGSTILVQDAGDLMADRIVAEQNVGAHLLRIAGDAVDAQLTNSLLARNILTAELIADEDTNVYFASLLDLVTIADNSIGAPQVLYGEHIAILNSIIAQPGLVTINPAISDGIEASHVLTNDRSTLPDTVYIELGAPTFVNAAGDDYHLTQTSLGVDNAPVDNNPSVPHVVDLDRHTRVVDLPGVANNFGPMDLGAYEVQLACAAADTIFCDGFEQQ